MGDKVDFKISTGKNIYSQRTKNHLVIPFNQDLRSVEGVDADAADLTGSGVEGTATVVGASIVMSEMSAVDGS